MAFLTRHFLSSASSKMAGRRALASISGPITPDSLSRRDMMFNLTSENSSFSRETKMGTRTSTVMSSSKTFGSPIKAPARAARTCCELSWVRLSSFNTGKMARTAASFPTSSPTESILFAAAVRTSASLSFKRPTYAGSKSLITTPISTPFDKLHISSATMYLTLQDESDAVLLTIGSNLLVRTSALTFSITAPMVCTDKRRTLSWSSSDK
mmetsp:Transcript_45798/g.118354  ORF Transcript_45798/g.118354 Transcript_45798/m.118354 type:complete len:211 (+) Transcript_45798:581-1213(+)